jgi:hypothetical protein
MELVVRHHLPVHQELHRFQVQLVLHLDRSALKVQQELQLVAQVPVPELEQQGPPVQVQVQAELDSQEQPVQEELLEELDLELRRHHQCLLGPML